MNWTFSFWLPNILPKRCPKNSGKVRGKKNRVALVFNQSPVIRIKSTIDRLEAWLVVETARGRISASSYGFNQAICLLPCRAVGQTSFSPDFFNRRAHVWCVCFDFSIPIWVWPKSDLDWLNRSLTCCRNCERPHTCIVLRIQLSQLLVDLLLLLKDGKNFTSY